jgi:putative restriction endonuclease
LANRRWSEAETIQALHLYFQLPFGKLHSGNPEIIQLANELQRTPSSIAMKLANFASLDPKITDSGRKGLDGATNLDREIYSQFGLDWTGLVQKAEELRALAKEYPSSEPPEKSFLAETRLNFRFEPFAGPSEAEGSVKRRLGQGFFRRAVLANYNGVCCITGIAEPRLLIASHIKPWRDDIPQRHNPANGLLLSATYDRAFDAGLITVLPDLTVLVSNELRECESSNTKNEFIRFHKQKLRPALRFDPCHDFLQWHNNNCYVGDARQSL